jgi:hypothetical protein
LTSLPVRLRDEQRGLRLMPLFRLYGYAVEPQRMVAEEDFAPPEGGVIAISAELRAALDAALASARGESRTTRVSLRVDPTPGVRTSELREAVMRLVFGGRTAQAEEVARELAARLSRSMDNRSPACLFLTAGYRESARARSREVALWIFPRDDAFRFRSQAHAIELLSDVFSRTSRLRKLALFSGRKLRTDFLEADVLDFQAGGIAGVANFWIEHFLEAGLSITPDSGTRILADAFRQAAQADLTYQQREQLQAALMAVRNRPARRFSLQQVADEFLDPGVADSFIAAAPNVETAQSLFRLNRDLFDRTVNYRVFRLDTGVWVSAPLEEIGQSVQVRAERPRAADGGTGERLRVEGTVVQDQLRSRRA